MERDATATAANKISLCSTIYTVFQNMCQQFLRLVCPSKVRFVSIGTNGLCMEHCSNSFHGFNKPSHLHLWSIYRSFPTIL